jgi:hypothetical protein
MLGLPSKQNKQNATKTQPRRAAERRRPVRYTLIPTLVGSMMIMMPRRESDGGTDWIENIPPME